MLSRLIITLAACMLLLSELWTPPGTDVLFLCLGAPSLFSEMELAVYRVALAVIGITLLSGIALWFSGRDYRWQIRIKKDYTDYSKALQEARETLFGFIMLGLAIHFFLTREDCNQPSGASI